MQTYPQYYPQMNNYGQQYNPQQPYIVIQGLIYTRTYKGIL